MDEQFDIISDPDFPIMEGEVTTMDGKLDGMVPNDFDPSIIDIDNPMPTYKELRDAGFNDEEAKNILDESIVHPYSKWELFLCLYESDDPVKAYKELLESKKNKENDELSLIDEMIVGCDLLGQSLGIINYNEEPTPISEEVFVLSGVCDCRSECKYNTGYSHKHIDYGYSE